MTGDLILQNTFFAFWYILGEYFLAIWGFGILVGIITSIIHLFRR